MAVLEGVNNAPQQVRWPVGGAAVDGAPAGGAPVGGTAVGGTAVGGTTRTRIRTTRYSPLFSELILRMDTGNLTGNANLENVCDVILDLYGVQYRNLGEIIEKTA